jgi:hypothetical protein
MPNGPNDDKDEEEPQTAPEPEPDDKHPSRNEPTYLDTIIETDDKNKPRPR